ncbi:terpene synthase [Coniophora puteana RWD-64-598 SS2]|uniref:Terpene synthase n=1 Tax=Coniophora puteana (strain RWD-64-598) TaxID=741705 RepID=A0A5M3MXY8_CONPW|nr:terpene synthase [Coniophora puteana RWD-64-598 SS2]EIW83595.1 terpene synthase [Coniophora puteana RWD-64-598 SS2]
MSPTATFTTTSSEENAPTKFILPDLVSDCTYPLLLNDNCEPVARASEQWLIAGARLQEPRRTKFMGLLAGELTAACYPHADASHLRVCVDFMNWLFNMDDWLDDFDVDDTWGMRHCCLGAFRDPVGFETDKLGGLMSKSFFSRFRQDGGPGCTERFIHTMDLFFIAVAQQAGDRANGITPDLESYITVRRDTSGCKPCFALIEYAAGIDLPDHVIYHPTLAAMEEATNDLVTWSNDIFSYNKEQVTDDTHNMIPVLMRERGLDLQGAVDFVGRLCKGTIERFETERARLPSWGPELDAQVQTYIEGLQNWIVGSLHWSFDSHRYFGKDGHAVKKHRIVKLLPKRVPQQA